MGNNRHQPEEIVRKSRQVVMLCSQGMPRVDTIRLGQHLSTLRRVLVGRADEESLVADMDELTRQYGRYGYRRIAALPKNAGWLVNDKRIERLWRRESLKVPMHQPTKGMALFE